MNAGPVCVSVSVGIVISMSVSMVVMASCVCVCVCVCASVPQCRKGRGVCSAPVCVGSVEQKVRKWLIVINCWKA